MHEFGIVQGVLEQAVGAAGDAGATRIYSVTLRVGVMREVVSDALDLAWEVLTDEDDLTRGCELVVETVGLRSRCRACGREFDHDRLHMRCPACGSADVEIVAGRELDVASMDVEVPGGADRRE